MEQKVDAIMERLWTYLHEQSLELVVSVEKEEYELSHQIKEEMDAAIEHVTDLLIAKGSIIIPREEAMERLHELAHKNMDDWYDILEVPEERRAK